MNNIGPSMDPCGTLYNIESESEKLSLIYIARKRTMI